MFLGRACHDIRWFRLFNGVPQESFVVFDRLQLPDCLLGNLNMHPIHWFLAQYHELLLKPNLYMDEDSIEL